MESGNSLPEGLAHGPVNIARQVREWPAASHENQSAEGSVNEGRRICDEWVFQKCVSKVATCEAKSKARRKQKHTTAPGTYR